MPRASCTAALAVAKTTAGTGAAPVHVRTIRDFADLSDLAEGWDALVRAMPRPSPFLLHGWVVEWWRHFGTGRELAVQAAFRDGELVAALPAYIRRTRAGLRVAEFLGAHESALADLLIAPGEPIATGAALVEGLVRQGIDYADFFGPPTSGRLTAAAGPGLRLVPRTEAPVLDLAGTWDEAYRERTTSRTRGHHKRQRRLLAERGRVEFALSRTPPELEAALEDAFALHRMRREGRPDDSSFGSPAGMPFHRDALHAIGGNDVARIVTLKVDGQPIAFHYFFVLCGAMYVHRLGFDPAWGRFSPGLLTTIAAIEAASAEGVRRVEFLGGTERYKMHFADRLDPLHQALGLAAGARGRAFVAARMASVALRMRVKRWEGLRRLYHEGLAKPRRLLGALRGTGATAGRSGASDE